MLQLPDLPNITLQGPFWSADAEVIQLADPRENWAFRTLLLDSTPRTALDSHNLLLPGTLLLLGFIRQVQIKPGSDTYTWERDKQAQAPRNPSLAQIKDLLKSGQLVLLLVQADPDPARWQRQDRDALPVLTCLAGDINLDVLTAETGAQGLYNALKLKAASPGDRGGAAGLPGAISVHGSGLSIYGRATLPWQTEPIAAPFQLARLIPDPAAENPGFRLTIEVDRLTKTEQAALISSWQQLSRYLNPKNPLNGSGRPGATPTWVTLELANPLRVPRLFWKISPWQAEPANLPLFFEQDEINLLLSDQQPYHTQTPPTSLARIVPDAIAITKGADNNLLVSLEAGVSPAQRQEVLTYEASSQTTTWTESIALTNLELAFSPVQTPQFLRRYQALSIPEWVATPSLFTLEALPSTDLQSLDDKIVSSNLRQKFTDNKTQLSQQVVVEVGDRGTSWLVTDQESQETYLLTKNDEKLIVSQPNPIEPAVVWGFMPLEDGWAQLPIPNLTDQIYLDANLALLAEQKVQTTGVFRQGAVSFGNDKQEVLSHYRAEQPWNLTLTNVEYLKGIWELAPDDTGFRLTHIKLEAIHPDVVVNGLFWLSTGKPTAADALPSLEDWTTAVQSIPLASVNPNRDLFPPAVTLRVDRLSFSLRQDNHRSPELQAWSFRYQTDTDRDSSVLRKLVGKGVLPADTFSRQRPLVWRRHNALPMIQVLPLTQSQSPPNYPSPSRQLVPFELATQLAANTVIALPSEWTFGVTAANGAATWVKLLSAAQPAEEWRSRFDLSLAALSLPGLVLDPNPGIVGLAQDASTQLPIQYRFDLPYTDEFNALAQLPKTPRNPEEVSPLPDSPPPEPPKPLTREIFAEHWQQLSDRATLAGVDAAAAVSKQGDQTVIRHLVEPFDWSVRVQVDLSAPIGRLTLENLDGTPASLPLSGNAALEGISGNFEVDANGALNRLNNGAGSTSFQIKAGSMAAYRDDQGRFRDQRGLLRSATTQDTTLLKTPVKLHEDDTGYELTSLLLESIALNVTDATFWQLWFRDLPVRAGSFSRPLTRSQPATAIDVNDPEALSREFNYLSGYEWRLRGAGEEQASLLTLFGLQFFPLTLETVSVAGDRVTRVEIVGRLQLPLSGGQELETLSNAVRVTFASQGQSPELQLTTIALEAEVGEWFLALGEGSEAVEAPLLQWREARLTPAKDGIVIDQITLKFFQFGAVWSVPLAALTFPQHITQTYSFPKAAPPIPIAPSELDLAIDLTSGTFTHTLGLTVALRLGDRGSRSIFVTQVRFALLGDDAGEVSLPESEEQTPVLFDDLRLLSVNTATQPVVLFTDNALQFQWQTYELSDRANLQLLPGMHLQSNQAPGFVALSFEVANNSTGIPDLRLKAAFIEALLLCRWGSFLQTQPPTSQATRSQVFGSSAGDLVFGYTAQWQAQSKQWTESLILNGALEVKNLISWAGEMHFDESRSTLTLPAARTSQPLNHLRHTLRILFNQCTIPAEQLTIAEGEFLFNLVAGQAWQFLAVVEHQFLSVQPNADLSTIALQQEHRWTTVQEVRLLAPQTFKQFLQTLDTKQTISPNGIDKVENACTSYLSAPIQDALIEGDKPELDQLSATTLLVEASAPHWIRKSAIAAAAPTTLQFLPNGSQHAILSNPQDYGPSAPSDPQWLLLTLPFLGRLQTQSLDQAATSPSSLLQVDPILTLQRLRTNPAGILPPLLLSLTNWGDHQAVALKVSSLDTALGRTWARLDPLSLEENWFRLQHPPRETQPDSIQSVLASLPDTPARLSRAVALKRAFQVDRPAYPPQIDPHNSPITTPSSFLWREDSLLAPQAVSSIQLAEGLQVLYTFEPDSFQEVNGLLYVKDVSGVGEPLDLRIFDPAAIDRSTPGVLRVESPTLISSEGSSASKITQACKQTNAISIEVWVKPSRVNQDNQAARIVTLSTDIWNRNFSLQQGVWDTLQNNFQNFYSARLRTDRTNNDGEPPLIARQVTPTTDRVHLVFTRDATGTTRLYINGSQQAEGNLEGTFANWDEGFFLALANELTAGDDPQQNRAWLGDYYLLAIYDRPLTSEQVKQNFDNQTYNKAFRKVPYGWHLPGLQLLTSGLLTQQSSPLQLHAAATQLPALLRQGSNPTPVSFAVSPYLGLEFRSASTASLQLRLLSAELLCLEATTGTLRPVASRFWEVKDKDKDAQNLYILSQSWAQETHRRLCPNSPIAVLRFREIQDNTDSQTEMAVPIVTTYSFRLVTDLYQLPKLTKRVFPLRSQVTKLRFREGQFAGSKLPTAIQPFELAPPQTTGVQPLYLTTRPAAETPATWAWGLSAFRVSVEYSQNQLAAIGSFGNDSSASHTLWWQAPQQFVQYRSAEASASSPRPTAGLPSFFRAEAIKSLLPVLPQPPLPQISVKDVFESSDRSLTVTDPALIAKFQRWQSVLPGRLRYWMVGSRSGAMVAVRNQLLRQSGLKPDQTQPQVGDVLVSGSIPVQHRVPRPVPLPPNQDRDRALQPWASYFDQTNNLLDTLSPADEAFFATAQLTPVRLQVTLETPLHGAIPTEWDGKLIFKLQSNGLELDKWNVSVQIVDGGTTFDYQSGTSGTLTASTEFSPTDLTTLQKLQNHFSGLSVGRIVNAIVRVKPTQSTDGFFQILSFPLRITDNNLLPLPLEPHFIHFEDPEYNRRLTSASAHATGNLHVQESGKTVMHTVTLSVDRREYNPDSQIALRYDWDDDRTGDQAVLELQHIRQGTSTPLNLEKLSPKLLLSPAKLLQLSLAEIQVNSGLHLKPGETLQFKLTVKTTATSNPIFLQVTLVETPVNPVPEVAYALLRHQTLNGQEQVECVRFAWGPEPARIELISAEDLRTEVVRRRAVFHWQDSVRSQTLRRYAIQKITQTGATHFPIV